MFDSMLVDSSSCQLKKIRSGISNKPSGSIHAMVNFGLNVLDERIDRFRLDVAGEALGQLEGGV